MWLLTWLALPFPTDPHSFPWDFKCVWQLQEDLTCPGSLAFLDSFWQSHLDSTAPRKRKSLREVQSLMRMELCLPSPREACPALSGWGNHFWSWARASPVQSIHQLSYCSDVDFNSTQYRHNDKGIHSLTTECSPYTRYWEERKRTGESMCSQGRRKQSRGNFISTDFEKG